MEDIKAIRDEFRKYLYKLVANNKLSKVDANTQYSDADYPRKHAAELGINYWESFKDNTSFENLLSILKEQFEREGKNPSTIVSYKRALISFKNFINDNSAKNMINNNSEINYYWVCQSQNYLNEKKENSLIAPNTSSPHRQILKELKVGDKIVSYNKNKGIQATLEVTKVYYIDDKNNIIVKVNYNELSSPIMKVDFVNSIKKHNINVFYKNSPIDKNYNINTGYCFKINKELYNVFFNIKTDLSNCTKSEANMTNIPLNQILYGPPGTGKTYKLENIIKDYIYPQIADDHESTNIYDDILLNCDLNWVEKIIFAFKINNSQNKPLTDVQISKLPLIQRWFSISSNYKDEKSLICSIRGEMQKNAIRKEGVYARHENNYFERQENGFILIDDGEKLYNELCEHYDININSFDNNIQTDKSILAKDYYVFCTFHQSYSYEEFVEGIRPIINKSKQDETSKDKNLSTMQFDFHCGIFKDMCIKAKKEPNKKFFIFIDEINRGNISKIFGELITLIEKDKREKVVEDGREYHTIEVTLPYTNDRFTVPNNLYIVGTMNTADKSLALLDVALRRRFEFVPMYPKYDLKDLKHKEFLEALNDRIYFEKKSADFLIGHTYFLGSEAEDLSEVMNKKVTPLLMEYFNAKKEMVEDIVGPLLEKEGYCIDKNEKYLLKVVRK